MIKFEDVFFQYSSSKKTALSNINLAIKEGRWLSVLGKNGSGKSTLMKLIYGQNLATSGKVTFNNKEYNKELYDDIKNITAKDIPTVKSGDFEKFFNSLTVEELDFIWKKKELRKKIERQLRYPGGMHEWHLVSRTPQFKYWDITAEKIRELRTAISDVKFINPEGVHGGLGSTKAHNELLEIIDSSKDYDMFVRRLNIWANYRLEGGVQVLPKGLRIP